MMKVGDDRGVEDVRRRMVEGGGGGAESGGGGAVSDGGGGMVSETRFSLTELLMSPMPLPAATWRKAKAVST